MSHWYDKEGNPKYEVSGKNGKRPSTLRDARKFGWVPSVSTIWGEIVNRHLLNKWTQTELMKAFHLITVDSHGILSFEEVEKMARNNFGKKQQETMNRGTVIHDHLELYFKGIEIGDQYKGLCQNVHRKLDEVCGSQEWEVEKSFSHPSGYGGKTDLCSDQWVVDFKTKEFPGKPDIPSIKKMVYDDHGVQLAAYDQGMPVNKLTGSRRLLNLFIDVGEGHRVLEWEHEDIPRFREMFNSALSLWKLTKKYNPEWHTT